MAPILGYWNVGARAESIRYLLHYTGTKFVDKQYKLPEISAELRGERIPFTRIGDWFQRDKRNLGLDIPDLPYWIDGDFKLTQSLTILRYLARKQGLVDDATSERQAKMELFEQQCVDVYDVLRDFAWKEEIEKEYPKYVRSLPQQLKPFSDYMGNKPWLLGEKLTYVDFQFFLILNRLREFVPDFLEGQEHFRAYCQRFESLPGIAEYRNSEDFPRSWPVFLPISRILC